MRRKRRPLILGLLLTSLLLSSLFLSSLLSGCKGGVKSDSARQLTKREGVYFDTVISISVYSDKATAILDECMRICKRMELIFDRENKDSELYAVNHRSQSEIEVSEDLKKVISCGIEFYKETEGMLDITIAPLIDVWDIKSQHTTLPDKGMIDVALEKVDGSTVSLSGNTLSFKRSDTMLDLGALAKGYISDVLKEYLLSKNVTSGIINLGGNVMTIGDNNGSPWKVGIQDPDGKTGEYHRVEEVTDQGVISAGTYERYFELDGIRYHHILDPMTGYPKKTAHEQVTIICKNGLIGDALSTSVLLVGDDKAEKLIDKYDARLFFS